MESEVEEIKCARDECTETFAKKKHNQIYHSSECCRIATNQRIMDEYYYKKDQKAGKTRYCIECTETKLSRYNDTKICSSCELKADVTRNKSIVGMIGALA